MGSLRVTYTTKGDKQKQGQKGRVKGARRRLLRELAR